MSEQTVLVQLAYLTREVEALRLAVTQLARSLQESDAANARLLTKLRLDDEPAAEDMELLQVIAPALTGRGAFTVKKAITWLDAASLAMLERRGNPAHVLGRLLARSEGRTIGGAHLGRSGDSGSRALWRCDSRT